MQEPTRKEIDRVIANCKRQFARFHGVRFNNLHGVNGRGSDEGEKL